MVFQHPGLNPGEVFFLIGLALSGGVADFVMEGVEFLEEVDADI